MVLHLYSRILLPLWGDALASGEKPYELQRYTMHNMNQMRFAQGEGQKILLIGTRGQAELVAVCHVAAAERDVGSSRLDELKQSLPSSDLREALTDYMNGGTSFDVLYFGTVYDVRSLHVTWKDFEAKLGCKISRNSGFPKVSSHDSGCKALDDILKKTGVVKHVFAWPGLTPPEAEHQDHQGASTSTSHASDASIATSDSEDNGSQHRAKRQRLWKHM